MLVDQTVLPVPDDSLALPVIVLVELHQIDVVHRLPDLSCLVGAHVQAQPRSDLLNRANRFGDQVFPAHRVIPVANRQVLFEVAFEKLHEAADEVEVGQLVQRQPLPQKCFADARHESLHVFAGHGIERKRRRIDDPDGVAD